MIDEYTEAEVNWFAKKYVKQANEAEINEKLEFVNNMIIANGSGSKKGNVYYRKWRRDLIDVLTKLNTEETVFNKLKGSVKSGTVFDRLKKYTGS